MSRFAIKELHYIFSFIIWSGLIDLQPDLLPGDPTLNSVCVLNGSLTVQIKENVIVVCFPLELTFTLSLNEGLNIKFCRLSYNMGSTYVLLLQRNDGR